MSHSRHQRQHDVRDKFFTYSERVTVYVEGKRAFEEHTRCDHNPYTTSKDLAALWRHGWDMAEGKYKGERSPLDQHDLTIQPGGKL